MGKRKAVVSLAKQRKDRRLLPGRFALISETEVSLELSTGKKMEEKNKRTGGKWEPFPGGRGPVLRPQGGLQKHVLCPSRQQSPDLGDTQQAADTGVAVL